MSTFSQTNRESQSRASTDGHSRTDGSGQTTLQQANSPIDSQREMLTGSPRVQSQIQLQQMLNDSPRVVAQAKLSEVLNNRNTARPSQQAVQLQEETSEEESLKTESQTAQQQERTQGEGPLQGGAEPLPEQGNRTGLPDALKAGVENLSGISLDDVKVHYNSSEPAQLQALAYTRGNEIHVGQGQEKHLAHEAWHVVQQKQGRVSPTSEISGVAVNSDPHLEAEASRMGETAQRVPTSAYKHDAARALIGSISSSVVQRIVLTKQDIGNYFYIRGPIRLRLIEITGERGVFETKNGTLSVHQDNVYRSAEDVPDKGTKKSTSSTSSDLMEDESKDVKGKVKDEKSKVAEELTYEKATKLLKGSSPLSPLSTEDLARADNFLNENMGKLSRKESAALSDLIKKAKGDYYDYQSLTTTRRPQGKRKRRKKEEKQSLPTTFSDESDSELSESESDPDERLVKYPMSMAPLSGRSHVHGIEEPTPKLRSYASGLPYADTYLGLFKQGSLVPRLINAEPNIEAHRKKMGEVEKRVQAPLVERDKLFAELDKLNEQIKSQKIKGEQLGKLIKRRDAAFKELQAVLSGQIRPHIESTLFGSSLRPTEKDIQSTEEANTQRENLKKAFLAGKDISAVGILAQAPVEKGLTRPQGTETHAEQSLLSTQTWRTLINSLVGAIKSNPDKPEEINKQSFTSLHLVLNRSTCIGCARELTMELVRFWHMIAKVTGLSTWREAKFAYEDYVNFTLSFPSIYEAAEERNIEFRNFKRIILGLQDAGWRVQISQGISASASSDESNVEADKVVKALTSIPNFFVKDWTQKIVRFPIPKALAEAVATYGAVLINGILYRKPEKAEVLTRDDSVSENSISADKVAEFKFLKTGKTSAPEKKETKDEKKDLKKDEKSEKGSQSKLSAKYSSLLGELNKLPYDETLQQMLLEGYRKENVSGSGMNCLIRSLFKSARIAFDEAMVKIVRQFLIDLGVAENGDMLDLLGVEGDSLVHFLQAQGVLGQNTGITVHFPGDSMQVVAGANQIHLWYSDYHFQALVPPG